MLRLALGEGHYWSRASPRTAVATPPGVAGAPARGHRLFFLLFSRRPLREKGLPR